MARNKAAWGFPRWGKYESETDPVSLKTCDFDGCTEVGDYPAPKSPNSNDKWHFCLNHVTEYNKNWDYFQGLDKEEAMRRAQEHMRESRGYKTSGAYDFGSQQSYGKDQRRRDALDILDLDDDASPQEIKSAYRALVKRYHPDTNPDDKQAAIKFQQITTAYEVLKVSMPNS